MKSISIEKRSVKHLINSFGFFSKESPLYLEIKNNSNYNDLLHELIVEQEIIETTIKDQAVYFSKSRSD